MMGIQPFKQLQRFSLLEIIHAKNIPFFPPSIPTFACFIQLREEVGLSLGRAYNAAGTEVQLAQFPSSCLAVPF